MTVEGTPLYAEIGARIRAIRKFAGMNQEELAAKTDVGRTSVVNIERGTKRVTLETLYLIARALDVPVYLFIPEDDR